MELQYLMHPNSKLHTYLLFHNSKSKTLFNFLLYSSLFSVFFILIHSSNLKPFLMQFLLSYYTVDVVDKSYMFFLCNGLLLLIAINSRLLHSSSSSPSTTLHPPHHHILHYHRTSYLEFRVSETNTASATPITCENVTDMEIEPLTPPEEEKGLMIVQEEEEEERNPLLSDTQLEDEEVEEGNALMIIDDVEVEEHGVADDTEELNKKCEDFIEKMKAAFRNQ